MTEPEVLNPARDKTCVIHTLLHYTPEDAAVSYVYRQRDDALTAARNAAEAHVADLRRAESAFLRSTVADDIPCSHNNPEFRWVYDTEIVRDLIAIGAPVPWNAVAQERQHRDAEILKGGVAFVVSDVSVHQPP